MKISVSIAGQLRVCEIAEKLGQSKGSQTSLFSRNQEVAEIAAGHKARAESQVRDPLVRFSPVVTSLAGFVAGRRPQAPGGRMPTPAAFR